MKKYVMTQEEKEYLSHYSIANYERPSVATDIVAFSILDDGKRESIRIPQKKKLQVLLIQRATYPYKNHWALPGGFCKPKEDVIDTAKREFYEETGLKDTYLKLIGVYGNPDRDPRGWIISNTFMALVDGAKCNIYAGTDAWEAQWFSVDLEENEDNRVSMTLSNSDKSMILSAVLKKGIVNTIESCEGIGFDHARIIYEAIELLREEVEKNYNVALNLIPEKFTLNQYQNACERVLGRELLTANFRRKIADDVEETEEMIRGEGYRPARLFQAKR